MVKVKPKLEEEKEIIGDEAPNNLIPQSAPVSTEHKAKCNILREKRCNIQQMTEELLLKLFWMDYFNNNNE